MEALHSSPSCEGSSSDSSRFLFPQPAQYRELRSYGPVSIERGAEIVLNWAAFAPPDLFRIRRTLVP